MGKIEDLIERKKKELEDLDRLLAEYVELHIEWERLRNEKSHLNAPEPPDLLGMEELAEYLSFKEVYEFEYGKLYDQIEELGHEMSEISIQVRKLGAPKHLHYKSGEYRLRFDGSNSNWLKAEKIREHR